MVDSVDQAGAFLRWLSEQKVVALDTETTGVDVYAPGFHVRLIQFGSVNDAWVMRFQEWKGLVKEVIRKFRGVWIMHNAKYDRMALKREGIVVPWKQVDDTMIALRVAEPLQSAALKVAATTYIAPAAALAQGDLHKAFKTQGWGWDTVPFEYDRYTHYAAMDVILTSRLWAHPTVQRGINSEIYALEMQALPLCGRMEETGMKVDLTYCYAQRHGLIEKSQAIKDDILARYGILISSGAQIGDWLLKSGIPIEKRTNGGKPSTDKEVMETLSLQYPGTAVEDICSKVLAYRKADKIVGSYLDNFIGLSDENDTLHPSIETVAAKTGRMSIRQPALQTLPKPGESEESRLVRKAVIPRNDNEVLISSDFEQIEMRLAAHLSGDPALINAFAVADADPDADFFAEMGKIVYRDESFTKKDKRRKIIKGTMYGLLYGAGAAKLAITAGITEDEARKAKGDIMDAFPGLAGAQAGCDRMVRDTGAITTMLGRELKVERELSYKGLNAYIQGSAADLFKRALVYLGNAGFEDYMIVPVHDEVVFSIPRDMVEDARAEIAKAMVINDTRVPVPAAPSEGLERWGDDA